MELCGSIDDSIVRLDYLRELQNVSAAEKSQLQKLKIEFKFLKTFVLCWQFMNDGDKFFHSVDIDRVLKLTRALAGDAGEYILSLHVAATDGRLPLDLNDQIYNVQGRFDLSKQHLLEDLLRVKFYGWHRYDTNVVELMIGSIQSNLMDVWQFEPALLNQRPKLVAAHERSLKFLRNVLQFAAKNHLKRFECGQIASAAHGSACYLYHCWMGKVNEDSTFLSLHNKSINFFSYYFVKVELLLKLFDFVRERVAEVLDIDDIVVSARVDIESLLKEMDILRHLLTCLPEDTLESIGIPEHIAIALGAVGPLYYLFGYKTEETKNMMCGGLVNMLKEIQMFISELYLLEQLNRGALLIERLKGQLGTICIDFQILRSFYFDEYDEHLNIRILTLGNKARSLVNGFVGEEIREDKTADMKYVLPVLSEDIKLTKEFMRKKRYQVRYDEEVPIVYRRDAAKYVKTCIQKLETQYSSSTWNKRTVAKSLLVALCKELKFLQSFLENSSKECFELARILNVAYEAENGLVVLLKNHYPTWYWQLRISDMVEEARLIRKEIEGSFEEASTQLSSSEYSNSRKRQVMVGYKDVADDILKQLTGGGPERTVITITGMAGLGKTTLATHLFENPVVSQYFDVRAWCIASQVHQPEKMLTQLLGQVVEGNIGVIPGQTVDNLAELLCQSLNRRRYFIVMDDMLGTWVANALQRYFPDDNNGSRILLTTRLKHVGLNVRETKIVYPLRYFTDEESKQLLVEKLFHEKGCPIEKLEIIEKIVKQCKGLPLEVAVIAGNLAKIQNIEEWKQVAEGLSLSIPKRLFYLLYDFSTLPKNKSDEDRVERVEMLCGLIEDSILQLDHIREHKSLFAAEKDQMQKLKMELKLLKMFLICSHLNRYNDATGADRVFYQTQALAKDVGEVIFSLYVSVTDCKPPLNLNGQISYMRKNIHFRKQSFHKDFSHAELSADNQDANVIQLMINSVQEIAMDLQIELALSRKQEKLVLAHRRSLSFFKTAIQLCKLDISMMASVAFNSSCFFCQFWVGKKDDNWAFLPNSIQFDFFFHFGRVEPVKLIGFFLELVEEVLDNKDGPVVSAKADIESLLKEMLVLRTLLMKLPAHSLDSIGLQEPIAKGMALAGKSIYYFNVGFKNEKIDKIMLDELVNLNTKIKFFNMELCFMDLLNRGASLIEPLKGQLETLCTNFQILKAYYFGNRGVHLSSRIFDLFNRAGAVIYSYCLEEIRENSGNNVLSDLYEKVEVIKADMRKEYHQLAMPIDYRRDGAKYVENCILIMSQLDFSTYPSAHIQFTVLKKELKLLQGFLENSAEECFDDEELKVFETRILNVANKAKYGLKNLLKYYPTWYTLLRISDMVEEARLIRKEIDTSSEKASDQYPVTVQVMVGYKDVAKEILEKLTGGSPERTVISIKGMAGLGKTTLAKHIFNNRSVSQYFDVRAWCCVSQVYQPEKLLRDLLGQVVEGDNSMKPGQTVDGLTETLCQSLKRRRYLIVMDDMWGTGAWNALHRYFPDERNGSRILFTTRLALSVRASNIAYPLRYFTDEESEQLLVEKLYHGKRCPLAKSEIIKQIGKQCKGLPLAIVLIAGVLVKLEDIEKWKQIAENLSRLIDGEITDLSKEVVELSFNHLPDYLKPCLLYFGAFPEDEEISTQELIRLWAAEGFLERTTDEQKDAEDKAMEYLMDLINRSLLIVSRRGSRGMVKTCQVHDLLHSFFSKKAKEETFFSVKNEDDSKVLIPTDFQHLQPEHVTGELESVAVGTDTACHDLDRASYEKYFVMLFEDKELSERRKCVRSLLHFGSAYYWDAKLLDAVISDFQSLRVLNLGSFLLENLHHGIKVMVQLRYLAICIHSNSIPPWIAQLRSLETFIVKGRKGEVSLPSTIWSMASLKHLHIDKRASFSYGDDGLLRNLATVSTPILPYQRNLIELARASPNLRKLKCISKEWSNSYRCNSFPEVIFKKLESLKVFYLAVDPYPSKPSFPKHLKKLTLSNFRLKWTEIAAIADLPNLEVLKLLFRSFEGKSWKSGDIQFSQLKYLKLESLDVEKWNTTEDTFPSLQTLVIHRCRRLEEVPDSFESSDTLRTIEVKWCSKAVEASAWEIHKALDTGNDAIKIIT